MQLILYAALADEDVLVLPSIIITLVLESFSNNVVDLLTVSVIKMGL